MTNTLISIVIPTKNRAKLLKEAINSALDQDYSDIEIIVIDDGGTDDTENMLNSLNSSKVRYYKNIVSGGSSAARNRGITLAKGGFVAFLDDDDIWYKNKLSEQIKVFNQNIEIGLVYSSMHIIYSDLGYEYDTRPQARGNIYKKLLLKNYVGATTSVMVRKSVFEKVGLFDESLKAREEYDLWIRISKDYLIDFVKEPLADYYIRNTLNRISSSIANYEDAIKKLNDKYIKEISNLDKKDLQVRNGDNNFFLASQAIKIGDLKTARKYYLKAFNAHKKLVYVVTYFSSFVGVRFIVFLRKMLK